MRRLHSGTTASPLGWKTNLPHLLLSVSPKILSVIPPSWMSLQTRRSRPPQGIMFLLWTSPQCKLMPIILQTLLRCCQLLDSQARNLRVWQPIWWNAWPSGTKKSTPSRLRGWVSKKRRITLAAPKSNCKDLW
jgi:hypothetical protein